MRKNKQSLQLRWLLMLLCVLWTWAEAQAVYTVAGNNTTLFGASWSPTETATNRMSQASSGVYVWTSASTVTSDTNVEFKVTDGSWSNSWPSDNYKFTVRSGYPLNVMFKTSDKSVFAWFAWTIAASTDCGLFSNGWSVTDTNNDMTTSDGINYTLTLSNKVLSQGTISYKVAADHAWTTSYGNGGGNASLNIPSAGTYDVTFSFNVNTKDLSATATKQVVAVDAPVFSVASGTSFEDLTGSVSLSCATSGATIYYNMTTNGSTPADPTSSSTIYSSAIALNSYATYHIKAVAIKNGTSSSVVSATYTVAAPIYTVAGNNTTLFGVAWDPSQTANDMTGPDANGVYIWQKTNVSLNAGTISFKVVKNRNWDTAYPGQDYNISVPAAGVYNLTITFDKDDNSVAHQLVRIPQSYTVAGNNTALFGAAWDATRTANDMTASGSTYTWTSGTVLLEAGNVEFKVVVDHNWDAGSYPADNYTVNVPGAGFYYLTVTFNASTQAVSATLTPVVGKTYTLYVYDPNGEPTVTVDGITATLTTEQGTHVTWYKYAYSGTTLPSAIVIRDHNNEVSSPTITPVDGATDYYYYPKYGVRNWTQTDANYAGPTTLYIAGSFQGNWSLVPMDTQDGNIFTFSSVAFANNSVSDNRFVFSTSDWDHAFRPTTNGEVVLPGQTIQASNVAGGTNAWSVPKGTYTITYTLSTHSFVLSGNIDPVSFYLVHWTDALGSSSPKTTLTTTDGVNYTTGDIALSNGEYFIFSNNVGNDWNSTTRFTCNNGDEVISNTVTGKQATEGGNNAYQIGAGGTWSFSYNIATNVWSATRTPSASETTFTIHVIDKQGSVPYVYVWDKYGNKLVGNFPGTQLSTTETINGETWYTTTVNAEDFINVIVSSDNNGARQTSDITNWTDSDLYIVYDSSINTGNEDADRPNRIVSTSATAPTEQVLTHYTFTVYVMADAAPYLYSFDPEWNGTWPGTQMTTTETLADGNAWYKVTYETLDQQIKLVLNDGNGHQTGNITQTEAVAYYVYNGTTGYTQTVEPTGSLYAIGQVGGNPWCANIGQLMTAASDGTTFTLNNVQIIAGATFAFATNLGSNEDDWTGLQHYRLATYAEGDIWEVTTAQTDKDNPTAIGLHAWSGADKTLEMDETGYYDITVDMKTMTVTIKRRYNALYMFYGDSESPYWKPNAGVPMFTTDGITYMLTNVTLGDGDTFQFATQLGTNENTWPANAYRLGADAIGDYWEVTEGELDIVLENALLVGSTKDFKMDSGTAGTYRVVVNTAAGTVALYHMAQVLGSKVILHLEQTSNVSNPRLWAYDKERDVTNEYYIHVDRPARNEIATARRVFFADAEPIAAKEETTADGRKWWTWEIDNAIVDFWFTRNGYDYASVMASALENADMTDIQWRKSGDIYLTWPAGSTALDEYTRDYYAAAAQEAANCAVMIEGHEYAYFTNTPGWDHVFCHAWYTDANGINHDLLTPPAPYEGDPCYPGALCELVGYDKDGYEVWRIDLTAAGVTNYPNGGILFNNGVDDNHEYEHDMNHDYYTGTGTTEAKEQSGDFKYSTGTCYDYCGVIVLGRSLGNIIRNGVVNGPVYTIEEDLIGVYFDPNAVTEIKVDNSIRHSYGALYCKDKNNFVTTQHVEKSLQQEGQVDYMHTYYPFFGQHVEGYPDAPDRYDQSNWVKLTLSTQYPGFAEMTADQQKALLRSYVGKVLPAETVRGQLVNNYNPEMRLALQALPQNCADGAYDPMNVYITSSFIGSQKGVSPQGEDYDFFFVTPKPQEYANITWAIYGGDDAFFVCSRAVYDFDNDGVKYYFNGFDLNGYFPVQWDLMDKPDGMDNYVGQMFMFKGIIRLADEDADAPAPRRITLPYETDVTTSRYVVSPIDIVLTEGDGGSIITAVTDVNAATRQVQDVHYVDVAGHVSNRPFDGVNIVVTRYTDGTVSTTKVLR